MLLCVFFFSEITKKDPPKNKIKPHTFKQKKNSTIVNAIHYKKCGENKIHLLS